MPFSRAYGFLLALWGSLFSSRDDGLSLPSLPEAEETATQLTLSPLMFTFPFSEPRAGFPPPPLLSKLILLQKPVTLERRGLPLFLNTSSCLFSKQASLCD